MSFNKQLLCNTAVQLLVLPTAASNITLSGFGGLEDAC
jgi:hypothetical protein